MQEAGSREGSSGPELAVLEGQLTWLVHVIGAVVRGRQSSSAAESQACLLSTGSVHMLTWAAAL